MRAQVVRRAFITDSSNLGTHPAAKVNYLGIYLPFNLWSTHGHELR